MLISPASAQEGSESYAVSGIASNDTLTVRSGPGAKNAPIAFLAEGAAPIYITGQAVLNGNDDWVPISFSGKSGWVRPKFLKALDSTNEVASNTSVRPATPDPAPEPGIVELAFGINDQQTSSSPTARFLYGLSVLTRHYLLDSAYQRAVGQPIEDQYWAKMRGTELAKLMEDSDLSQVDATVVNFCHAALLQDIAFQATYDSITGSNDSSRDETISFLLRAAKAKVVQEPEGNGDFGDAVDWITKIQEHVEEGRSMMAEFVAAKNRVNLHEQWANILSALATKNPELGPFANDPRVTDPTWDFLRSRDTGDVFFGQCITSRGREDAAPILDSPKTFNLGDLGKGAIRVHFSSQDRAFACVLEVDGPQDSSPAFVAKAVRGHFGLTDSNESTWVARGMVDTHNNGVGSFPIRHQGLLVYHFPITGAKEDSETQGSVLLYLREQYKDGDEASATARDVSL